MNIANLYLYQPPLFTCIFLFVIGLALGMSVTFLFFEMYYSVVLSLLC